MFKKSYILPSITTTKNADWEKMIGDTRELEIRECALFLTNINKEEKKRFFDLLKKSPVRSCPFVHLRHDEDRKDIDFLIENYGAKIFNIHCDKEYPLKNDLLKYHKMIYVENVFHAFDEKELERYAGICLDISHLENDRLLKPERFKAAEKTLKLKKFKIGCNHISGICPSPLRNNECGEPRQDTHIYYDLSNFDYLKRYPKDYFSKFCALELENSLKDQLIAKDYVFNILKEKFEN